MKKWKVGIAGLSRGKGFVSVFDAHPEVSVTAVCDIDGEKLAEVGDAFRLPDRARFNSFDDFLDADTEIVVIATPIPLHTEQSVRSLEAGRHVLCEQTMAYTVEECRRVIETARKTGLKYMMAENCCYYHFIREWRKVIEAGRIGRVVCAETDYSHQITALLVDPLTGRFNWRHDRPPAWYCAHNLGPLLTVMDDRVVRACGVTSGYRSFPEYEGHPGFLDFEMALFETRRGAFIKMFRSQVQATPYLLWFSLMGTKGYLENRRFRGEGGFFFERGGKEEGEPFTSEISDPGAPPEALAGGHGTSEYYLIRDFLSCLENDTRPPIDAVRAGDFTVPGLIAHESAMAGGRWLEVPLL